MRNIILLFVFMVLVTGASLRYPELMHDYLFFVALVSIFFGFLAFVCLRKMQKSLIAYGIEFFLMDVLLFWHNAVPLQDNVDLVCNWVGIHICLAMLTVSTNLYERRKIRAAAQNGTLP